MKAWSSGTHEARQRHGVPEMFVPASLVHWPLLPSLVALFLTSLPPNRRRRRGGGFRLLDPVHPLWGSGLIASDEQQSSSARATARATAHHHRPIDSSTPRTKLPSRRRQPPQAPPTPPSPPLLPPLLPGPPVPAPPPAPPLARRERRWHRVQGRRRHHLLVDDLSRRQMSWCTAASCPRLRFPACCRRPRHLSPYLQVTAWVEEGRHSGGGLTGRAGGERASWLMMGVDGR